MYKSILYLLQGGTLLTFTTSIVPLRYSPVSKICYKLIKHVIQIPQSYNYSFNISILLHKDYKPCVIGIMY